MTFSLLVTGRAEPGVNCFLVTAIDLADTTDSGDGDVGVAVTFLLRDAP
jgi:hypothetical protein